MSGKHVFAYLVGRIYPKKSEYKTHLRVFMVPMIPSGMGRPGEKAFSWPGAGLAFKAVRGVLEEWAIKTGNYDGQRAIAREVDDSAMTLVNETEAKVAAAEEALAEAQKERQEAYEALVPQLRVARVRK